jgi:uncharacterized protein (TIGR03437 family)
MLLLAVLSGISTANVKSPLVIEANRGQGPASAEFVARTKGYSLMISSRRLEWRSGSSHVSAVMEGAREVRGEAENRAPGVIHYLVGAESQWVTNVPSYERVRYRAVYPGIDVVYYSKAGGLEYDFVVTPGADPGRIRLRFDGGRVRIDEDGDLVVETANGSMRQHRPLMYQAGRPIEGRFVARGDEVRFAVGRYDRKRELVIDPALGWSSYLGSAADELGEAVAVDSTGAVYLAGSTTGSSGYSDAYVLKFSPDGATAVFTTVWGGSYDTWGHALAVDAQGNVYLAGETDTPDLPVTGSYTPSQYSTYYGDGYLTKFDPTGTRYVYSNLFGGSGEDVVYGLALDSSNHAWIVGATASPDYPVSRSGAPQASAGGGVDAFATAFDANGTPYYSTFLAGSGDDYANAVAVGTDGAVYVTGSTTSTNFLKTASAVQVSSKGGADAFVVKLSAAGALVYATYLGGSADDIAYGIAVDAGGAAYVTGQTLSADFPVQNAAQGALGGTDGKADLFVTKLDSVGATLVYSTYVGGGDEDGAYGIAVDAGGNAFVSGYSKSKDFPLRDAFQQTLNGPLNAVALALDASGQPIFESFLGGSGDGKTTGDTGGAAALNCASGLVVAGSTSSTDFPVTSGVYGAKSSGGLDAFVARVKIGTKATIQDSGVVNSATLSAGPVAPGSLVSVLGSGLALAGGSLTVNGNAVPVISASDGRIDFQLPPDAPAGDAKLTVAVPCGTTDPAGFTIAAVAPYVNQSVLNEDGTPNAADHPAATGSVITAKVTGAGPLDPMPTVTATVGGWDATVQSLSASSGQKGWAQAKIVVPGLGTGTYDLKITIGGASGGGGTVYVQ